MPDTPPLKTGMYAILHGSFWRWHRGRTVSPVPLKSGNGGSVPAKGVRGLSDTPPPPCRGGLREFFPEHWGGVRDTPLPRTRKTMNAEGGN